jgi:hypothetical protein
MTPGEQEMFNQNPIVAGAPSNAYSNLTDFDRQQMRETGQTPASLVMQRRLGEQNRFFTDASGNKRDWINPKSTNQYRPEELYIRPEFRTIYQKNPQQAAHAFEALTGQPLQAYEGVRASIQKQQVDREKQYEKTFYDEAVAGNIQFDADGNVQTQEFTIDPLTGKKIPSGKWSSATGAMKEISEIGIRAFPEIAQLMHERARKKAEQGNPATTTPATPRRPIPAPATLASRRARFARAWSWPRPRRALRQPPGRRRRRPLTLGIWVSSWSRWPTAPRRSPRATSRR